MHTIPFSRELQLSLFDGNCRIRQDQDLIDVIISNKYTKALGVGDIDYFKNFVECVDRGVVNFCIYIQREEFNFNDLVTNLNYIIKNNMAPGALIYLSLNKYVATPGRYDCHVSADYDTAIEQFISTRVNAEIESYQPCGFDFGNKFNWVHPLTRFYLRVCQ
jgi:hypothetical protein